MRFLRSLLGVSWRNQLRSDKEYPRNLQPKRQDQAGLDTPCPNNAPGQTIKTNYVLSS